MKTATIKGGKNDQHTEFIDRGDPSDLAFVITEFEDALSDWAKKLTNESKEHNNLWVPAGEDFMVHPKIATNRETSAVVGLATLNGQILLKMKAEPVRIQKERFLEWIVVCKPDKAVIGVFKEDCPAETLAAKQSQLKHLQSLDKNLTEKIAQLAKECKGLTPIGTHHPEEDSK